MGLASLLLWSSSFAVYTHLNGQIGTVRSAACVQFAAGVLGLAVQARRRRLRGLAGLPKRYLLLCGGLFVAYIVSVYLGIHLSGSPEQAVEVALMNYLWPTLMLVFSVPVLRMRARWFAAPGVAAALAGLVLVVGRGAFSWSEFVERLVSSWTPYALGLTAAVTWALYSVLTRRWLAPGSAGAVPIFFLVCGVTLSALSLVFPAPAQWSARTFAELAFLAVLPGWLAYTMWESAMQGGDIVLVTSASYLAPMAATILSCLYLGMTMTGRLWGGCALLVAGAVVCRFAVTEPRPNLR